MNRFPQLLNKRLLIDASLILAISMMIVVYKTYRL